MVFYPIHDDYVVHWIGKPYPQNSPMNFPKITSTLSSFAKNNLDTIIFAILVIAL